MSYGYKTQKSTRWGERKPAPATQPVPQTPLEQHRAGSKTCINLMVYSLLQHGCAGNTWGEQPDSALITPQASG